MAKKKTSNDTLSNTIDHEYSNAWGLSGALYTDPHVTEAEKEHMFFKDWICVGREEEVQNKGDYFTFDLCGEPLIIVHSRDGNFRALSNICRHRGARLVEGTGNTRAFLCPYHHWGYDTTGRLTGSPMMDEHTSFDPANCRLPEVPLMRWRGYLFVSLAKEPEDFTSIFNPVEEIIANYHVEEMKLRYLTEEVWDTNWKCLMENFMEGYHLSPLHRETLHNVNPTRLCRHLPTGPRHFGYSVGFDERIAGSDIGHADLSDEERRTCFMLAVPPGFAIGISGDYCSFLSMRPEGPGKVRTKMGLYFYGDRWSDAEIKRAIDLFDETMAEDKAILVDLQSNFSSRFHAVGPIAPRDLEGTILDFHNYLAERLANRL